MPFSTAARGTRSSPTETSWARRHRGIRPPESEMRWRPKTVAISAATYEPATKRSKRLKRSGEELRPCCPRCSCSTSLRTVDRRHGRTHPPDGRRNRLSCGCVMADPLPIGLVPTQRSNKSKLLRSNLYFGFRGGLNQAVEVDRQRLRLHCCCWIILCRSRAVYN